MHRIAIFASGEGTNAEAIIRYFKEHKASTQFSVWSNREEAGVLKRAKKLGVPTIIFSNEELQQSSFWVKISEWKPDLIVLAGFLRKIPKEIIEKFSKRIINIHPSLLPKYGGKGMYGLKVHEAVKQAGESETGITIHLVDEEYDKGEILFQQRISINPYLSVEEISREVRKLELFWYPRVIEEYLKKIY